MNRRVLIVSPHFPPVNAPDMQRVRQALPYLAAAGWDAEVLAVEPEGVDALKEPLLAAALPPHVPVHRVSVMSPRVGRWLGRGTLARRALRPMRRAGDALFGAGRFDLVFFSTTQFSVFRLGAEWRERHGVPFVLDWQDPWVTDFYSRPGAPRPPGGWRYRWSQAEARRHEGACLAAASGWVGTSESYQRDLRQRYPWFSELPQAVIPFGFEAGDFATAARLGAAPAFARRAGTRHIVYVGAAGPIMEPALRTLFEALRDTRRDDRSAATRFHFIGTSYAPADRAEPSVLPIARAQGVAGRVEESPGRIGYFSSLQTLQAADAVLLLGSADAGYNPSKIAALLHTGKPVLAIVGSPALAERLRDLPGATVVTVGDGDASARIADFCAAPPAGCGASVGWLTQTSAANRTRELASLFDRARQYFEARAF